MTIYKISEKFIIEHGGLLHYQSAMKRLAIGLMIDETHIKFFSVKSQLVFLDKYAANMFANSTDLKYSIRNVTHENVYIEYIGLTNHPNFAENVQLFLAKRGIIFNLLNCGDNWSLCCPVTGFPLAKIGKDSYSIAKGDVSVAILDAILLLDYIYQVSVPLKRSVVDIATEHMNRFPSA